LDASGIEIRKRGDIDIAVIDLKRQKRYICNGCGKEVFSKHSLRTQEVRHLHL